ncbi:uncharacterized protein LOC130736263 [Lotus japonicus]|uniref:uncharacterized protein LOC130736263 n=1 Tax=Lotus japonicus TaxID=34305 RepID=UPI0025871FB5|nr:uncharacterized protein LOC130736263 [Lotus japonicus]
MDTTYRTSLPGDSKFVQYRNSRGEISISTSRSTKIYVNIGIPEANELIQSFKDSDEFHKVATSGITKSPMLDMDKKKTISEILEIATSKSDMNGTYCCAATINDILLKNGFRLELDVRDATNSTIFVVFDDIAEQIARVKLHDLLSGDKSDLDLPPQLLKTIGSSHVFQIKMSTYFESHGRQSFTANKLLKPVVKIEKEAEKEATEIEKEAEKEATEVNLPDKVTETILEISDSSIGSPDINMSDSPQKRRKLRLQREGKKPSYPEKEEEENLKI